MILLLGIYPADKLIRVCSGTKNYVKGYSRQLHWWPEGRLTVGHFVSHVHLPIQKNNNKKVKLEWGKGGCDLYCLEIRSALNSPTKANTKRP